MCQRNSKQDSSLGSHTVGRSSVDASDVGAPRRGGFIPFAARRRGMNGALSAAWATLPPVRTRAWGAIARGGDSPRAHRIYVAPRQRGTSVSTRQRYLSCRGSRDHTCNEMMGERRAVLCPCRRQVPLLVVTTLLMGVRTELVGEYNTMRKLAVWLLSDCERPLRFFSAPIPRVTLGTARGDRSSRRAVACASRDRVDDTCGASETVDYAVC